MKSQKHLFNLNPDIHYLNCAFKSPLLTSGKDAAIVSLEREQNPYRMTSDDFFTLPPTIKSQFAELVHCDAKNVAIIPSTSYGLSMVLKNTKAKINGHAITIKDEFASGYMSLDRWCREQNNELKIIAPDDKVEKRGQSWNQNILDAISNDTSVILISSVHWMSGLKFDLKSIGEKCEKYNVVFIVDGAQSVGALSMDVKEFKIDALICPTYKWLFGPYSVAFAYLSDKYNNGTPLEESWLNRKNSNDFSSLSNYESEYTEGAGRYNVGETSNFVLLPIVNEGLNQILKWGVDNIQNYCHEIIQPLKTYLSSIGVVMEDDQYFSNHLFSLKLPSHIDIEKFKTTLTNRNIYVSIRGSHIRVSFNVFNDKNDVQQLINVIRENI